MKMVKPSLRRLFFKLCDLCGFNGIFRILTRGRLRILVYHGLIEEPLPVFSWTNLPAKEFQWQMKYLQAHYEVVRLPDYLNLMGTNSYSSKKCLAAITFDDGLRSVAEIAEPILDKLNLPAICFVSPGLASGQDAVWTDSLYEMILSHPAGELDCSSLGMAPISLDPDVSRREKAIALIKKCLKETSNAKRKEFLKDLFQGLPAEKRKRFRQFELMGKDEILRLHRKGRIRIAPHAYSHPILARLSPEEQESEINQSIQDLKIWGIDPKGLFAYPNGQRGDFTELTKKLLRNNKMEYAFTSLEDFFIPGVHDSLEIPRIPIGGNMERNEFKAKLSGLYFFLKKMKKRILDHKKPWFIGFVLYFSQTILASMNQVLANFESIGIRAIGVYVHRSKYLEFETLFL